MKFNELSQEQKNELKQKYIDNKLYEQEHRGASYGELAQASELVTDEEIEQEFGGYEFLNDDFVCTAGEQETTEKLTELKNSMEYNIDEIIGQHAPDINDTLELWQFINTIKLNIEYLEEYAKEYEDIKIKSKSEGV